MAHRGPFDIDRPTALGTWARFRLSEPKEGGLLDSLIEILMANV